MSWLPVSSTGMRHIPRWWLRLSDGDGSACGYVGNVRGGLWSAEPGPVCHWCRRRLADDVAWGFELLAELSPLAGLVHTERGDEV